MDYYEDLLKELWKIMFYIIFDKGLLGFLGFMFRNEKLCVVVMVRGGMFSCFYDNLFLGIEVKDN